MLALVDILTVLVIAPTVAGYSIPSTHVVHEQRDEPPKAFHKRGRVHPDSILPVRIGLTQTNLDNGYDYLMDVSSPESPNYGRHWTEEQVIATFQPIDETVEKVRQWLESHGFANITHSDNKGFLAFNAPSQRVEALLHAEYHEYEDALSGIRMPSCDRYHVPREIQEHIDYITPGLKLLSTEKPARKKRSLGYTAPYATHPMRRALNSSRWPDPNNLTECWQSVSPACLKYLYQLPDNNFTAHPNNTFGLYESELQFYDQPDLNLFFQYFAPHVPQNTAPIAENIDGGVSTVKAFRKIAHKYFGRILQALYHGQGIAGDEAMLDLDAAYPIVYPQTITVLNENDLISQAWENNTYTWGFNQLLDAIDGSYCTYSAYGETGDLKGVDISYPQQGPFGWDHPLQCGVFKPTNVISASYGGQEIDLPISYQKRQCNEFMKLALRGTSFIVASGDNGVQYLPSKKSNYGRDGPTGCLGKDYKAFNPAWPNTCPYVTNVGGTRIPKDLDIVGADEPEVVVDSPDHHNPINNYSTGGGFSNIYPMPSYQKSAVETYLSQYVSYETYAALAPNVTDPYVFVNVSALQGNGAGLFNRIGRGYPDVSAIAFNQACIYNKHYHTCYGTSVATPIFAAVINRINEERLAAGKRSVGFLNPAMYANPQAFRDIVSGHNEGCNTTGFSAAPGWDAATGLGSPLYPKLLEVFMKLP